MKSIPLLCLAAALLFTHSACKGNGHESGEAHEAAVTRQPATSLAAGIGAAQKSEPGLQFLAAEIESEGGKVICSVLLAKGDAAREINVDATNGSIVNAEDEKLGKRAHAVLKLSGGIATGAAQAIEAALKRVPGTWAKEIELVDESGALVYEVSLAGGKEPMRVQISAADGSVKQVSEVEEDEEEGGEKGEGKEER